MGTRHKTLNHLEFVVCTSHKLNDVLTLVDRKIVMTLKGVTPRLL